jgi:hypothetical protein
MTLVEKCARQPAILLAANSNNPAKAEQARHEGTFLALPGGSQVQRFLESPHRSVNPAFIAPLQDRLGAISLYQDS